MTTIFHITVRKRCAAVSLVTALLLAACSKTTPAMDDATAPAPSASATALNPDADARETMDAIRARHFLACQCGDFPWATCQDEAKGYAAVLACAKGLRAKCQTAKAQLPPPKARTPCAKDIETAATAMVTTSAEMFDGIVSWLEQNKAKLEGLLSREPLTEVCQRISCANLPNSGYGSKYAAASYATISSVSCTKELFMCSTPDNVCWVSKVASRLGVACDSTENSADPLSVRATGTRLQ